MQSNEGLTERTIRSILGVALLFSALSPGAGRRLRTAGLASAGCGVATLAVALSVAVLGMVLLAVSGRVLGRLLGSGRH